MLLLRSNSNIAELEYAPFSGDSTDHDLLHDHQQAARAVALDRGIARLSRGYCLPNPW